MKRRWLSILTALALSLSLLPGTAWAESGTPDQPADPPDDAVARVTYWTESDNRIQVEKCKTFEAAWDIATAAIHATITLLQDAIVEEQLVMGTGEVTLSSKGSCTLTTKAGVDVGSGVLTIENCSIKSPVTCLTVRSGGVVRLLSCTIESESADASPAVRVNGGEFTMDVIDNASCGIKGTHTALHIDAGTVNLYRGTFEGDTYSIFMVSGTLADLLPIRDQFTSCYFAKEDADGELTRIEDLAHQSLTEKIVVDVCLHPSAHYEPLDDNNFHRITCDTCGLDRPAPCSYNCTMIDAEKHTAQCGRCLRERSEEHIFSPELVSENNISAKLIEKCFCKFEKQSIATLTIIIPDEVIYGQKGQELSFKIEPETALPLDETRIEWRVSGVDTLTGKNFPLTDLTAGEYSGQFEFGYGTSDEPIGPFYHNFSFTVTPATPEITINVPNSIQKPGDEVPVDVSVKHPTNAAMADLPAPWVTISYDTDDDTGDWEQSLPPNVDKFTIPEGTPEGTVITITAATLEDPNRYNAAAKTVEVMVTGKTPVTVSGIEVKDKTYDGKPLEPAGGPVLTTADGDKLEGLSVKYTWNTTDGKAPVDAGTYELTLALEGDGSDRYILTNGTLAAAISKAKITITADDKTCTDVSKLPKWTYTVKGLAENEQLKKEPVPACDTSAPDENGAYTITVSGAEVPDTKNYEEEIEYVSGKLTVTSVPLVTITGVTVEDKAYDGKAAEPSGTVKITTQDGTELKDVKPLYTWSDAEGKKLDSAPVNAGSYKLTISVPADSGYTGSKELSFTIRQAPLSGEPAFTKVTASGKTLADVTLSKPDGWPAGSFVWKGGDKTAVEQGTAYEYTFTPTDPNYAPYTRSITPWEKASDQPDDPDKPDKPDDPDKPDKPDQPDKPDKPDQPDTPVTPPAQTATRVEVNFGLRTVPAGLAGNPYLNTTAKIIAAMESRMAQLMGGTSQWDMAVYDVALMASPDGGATWAPASKDNFPANGRITVTIPYPTGTNSSSRFTVVHMFTTGDFGKTPGGMEVPAVFNTPYGIRFDVTGLSPIAVAWSSPGSAAVSVQPVRPSASVRPREPSNAVTNPGGPPETKKPAEKQPCGGGALCPSGRFRDLGGAGTWYHDAVDYMLEHELMNGYENGTFGPNDRLSRAMVAQILYNKEGRPSIAGGGFSDVPSGAWYAQAVSWASIRGIVTGYGDGRFGPEDYITREQLVIILWRYAWRPASSLEVLPFAVTSQDSVDALCAMRWAVESGILDTSSGMITSSGYATRAETAQMLVNFWEQ